MNMLPRSLSVVIDFLPQQVGNGRASEKRPPGSVK